MLEVYLQLVAFKLRDLAVAELEAEAGSTERDVDVPRIVRADSLCGPRSFGGRE